MQRPVQLIWRHLSPSEPVAERVHALAAKLEQFEPRITGCLVVLEGTTEHHRQSGSLYRVRIELTVPGAHLVVGRNPRASREHMDLQAAVSTAFREARRQLQDHRRKVTGSVKLHEEQPLARVARLFPDEGYGFLETADRREIYFHARSVLRGAFPRLAVGSTVRFVEEPGDQGPQATTVAPVRPRARARAAHAER